MHLPKKKPKLNYGAKTTLEARARQFKHGLFTVRGKTMWCNVCDKPVQHERRCTVVKHIESAGNQANLIAACKHVLKPLFPEAHLHVCVAHKLHGTGGALTSTSFDMCDTLFASSSLVHAQKQAGRRRRWFALLRSKGVSPCLPPKVGATRWCSWRDAADWWCPHVHLWKEFVAQEVERTPWRGKETETPLFLHHIHNILRTKFENLKLRLAFVSDHSQSLSQTLNTLQSSQGGLAPFVHDFVLNLEEEYRELTKLDAKFSSRVEERLKRFRDPAPYRAFLGAAAKRAADHLTNVRAKNPEQWCFYKELRILNPANLSTMSHDISLYSTLQLPLADPKFMGEWRK